MTFDEFVEKSKKELSWKEAMDILFPYTCIENSNTIGGMWEKDDTWEFSDGQSKYNCQPLSLRELGQFIAALQLMIDQSSKGGMANTENLARITAELEDANHTNKQALELMSEIVPLLQKYERYEQLIIDNLALACPDSNYLKHVPASTGVLAKIRSFLK